METDYVTEDLADLLADDIVGSVLLEVGDVEVPTGIDYALAYVSRFILGLTLAVEEGRLAAWLEERHESTTN